VSSSARPLTRPASNPGDTFNFSAGPVCTVPALNLNRNLTLLGISASPSLQFKIKNARCSLLYEPSPSFRSARSALKPLIFLTVPHNETNLGAPVSARLNAFTVALASSHSSLATLQSVTLSHTLHTHFCVSHTAPTHEINSRKPLPQKRFRISTQDKHTFSKKINTHTIPFPRTFYPFRAYLPADRFSRMIEKPGKRDSTERRAS